MAFRVPAGLAGALTATGLAVATASAAATPGAALPLVPHQAIYELSLAAQSDDIVSAHGRIAMELKTVTCGVYDLDYRFVARFDEDEESTLTDQQTLSTENDAGTEFRFSTKTFVDGTPDKEVRGEARRVGETTTVTMEEPEPRSFALPPSLFPMQHTRELIEKAKAGERLMEARLFDGDDDAEKLLTSTAIISPNERARPAVPDAPTPDPGVSGPGVPDGIGPDPAVAAKAALQKAIGTQLSGVRSWRISESYYNSDSNPDGLPVFQTSYVLYENGVSDELKLDFGAYALGGSLSRLDLFDPAACRK